MMVINFDNEQIIDEILDNSISIRTDKLFFRYQLEDNRKIFLLYEPVKNQYKSYLFILSNDEKEVLYCDSLIINHNDNLYDSANGVLNRVKYNDTKILKKINCLLENEIVLNVQELHNLQKNTLISALYLFLNYLS